MQSKGHTLLLRADANTQMGTGHLMRCLALGQAWQEQGNVAHFALATEIPTLETRLTSEGIITHCLAVKAGSDADAIQTTKLAHHIGARWVVVDGYQFNAGYQQAIKQAQLRLLFLDDYGHAEHYYADLVLNQNISADEAFYYNREPYTRLLLGRRYTLLRREFWAYRGWQRTIPVVARRVLVTMGGSDPNNVTLRIIRALEQATVKRLEAIVVVGAHNPHIETLRTAVQFSRIRIQLQQNSTHMPELMAWADVAISAGGSTCWELAFMGLPSLVGVIADNQLGIALGLARQNVAQNLGWFEAINEDYISEALISLVNDYARRVRTSEAGHRLVDGKGGQRIGAAIQDYDRTNNSCEFCY